MATWWARAPRQVFSFAPAAKVWSKWREPHSLLHALVTPIRQNDSAKIASLKQAIEKLSDDAHFQREVERTDRNVLRRRLGDAISGRALDQLQTATREAVKFARQWIDRQEGQGKKSQGMSPSNCENTSGAEKGVSKKNWLRSSGASLPCLSRSALNAVNGPLRKPMPCLILRRLCLLKSRSRARSSARTSCAFPL